MVRLPVGGTTWLLTYNVTPIPSQLLGTVTCQRKVAVCPRGTGRGVLESVPRKSARHTRASSSTSGGGSFDSARAGEACHPLLSSRTLTMPMVSNGAKRDMPWFLTVSALLVRCIVDLLCSCLGEADRVPIVMPCRPLP